MLLYLFPVEENQQNYPEIQQQQDFAVIDYNLDSFMMAKLNAVVSSEG